MMLLKRETTTKIRREDARMERERERERERENKRKKRIKKLGTF